MARPNNVTVRSFPHARGDGPEVNKGGGVHWTFSPRTWGWSAVIVMNQYGMAVFPTHVGMVPLELFLTGDQRCFPHARGDGPPEPVVEVMGASFSPRTWGWSLL